MEAGGEDDQEAERLVGTSKAQISPRETDKTGALTGYRSFSLQLLFSGSVNFPLSFKERAGVRMGWKGEGEFLPEH
jgi:hypothetical protein